MDQRPSRSPETLAAQALGDVDPGSGGLAPVINLSTTYEQLPDGSNQYGLAYTRADNPTYEAAEQLLAALEGAGCACVLFASGMAAITAVFQSLLPGDHVLVGKVLYWGVRKWLAEFALTWGLDVEFVDTTDLGAVESAIRPGRTRLVWVETPANPMWDVTDLTAVCQIAHAAGARVAVDNTVPTPVLTTRIRVTGPGGGPPPAGSGGLADRVRRVLDGEINPAIAAHRGRVVLADVRQGWVRVRLEGGCQGCSLAEVTLRQGIEPLLRARVPEMVGLIDVTDHEAGTAPFFAPAKR
jgi:Fe-S cluster biogenesis protein NfuA